MRRRSRAFVVAVIAATFWVLPLPASGNAIRNLTDLGDPNQHGTVRVCQGSTNCTETVQVVCPAPGSSCTPAITIRVSQFPGTVGVHAWLIKGEPDSFLRYDCIQDIGLGRAHLGDGTTTTTGTVSITAGTIPAGGWSYGPAWVCVTTAPHTGGGPSNTVDETPVVVSPA